MGSGEVHTRGGDTGTLEQHCPIELSVVVEMLHALMSNMINTQRSEALEMKSLRC